MTLTPVVTGSTHQSVSDAQVLEYDLHLVIVVKGTEVTDRETNVGLYYQQLHTHTHTHLSLIHI